MKKYAEIIDKGECFSTLNVVNGINWKEPSMKDIACASEWKKYDFYPSNGLVGEIVDSFYSEFMRVQVYVMKINNILFIPMSEKGIRFISEEDMNIMKTNTNTLIDLKTEVINREYETPIYRSFSFGKPSFKEDFGQELVNNVKKRTLNFTQPMYIEELVLEGIMYSCDMCLEFEQKAGFLSNDWILHISHEVADALSKYWIEFLPMHRKALVDIVQQYIKGGSAQMLVRQYYYDSSL